MRRTLPRSCDVFLVPIFLLGCGLALAQQATPLPKGQPPADSGPASAADAEKQDDSKPKTTAEQQTGTVDDRIFEVMPNYGTVNSTKTVPPMTTGQKFRLATVSGFDYFAYPFNAALAGLGQASNSPKSWGQGGGAYAKRFGANFADNTIGTFMTTAIFSSLVKQDPRYYRMAEGKISHRILYPISRLFVTRTDASESQFNYTEVVGNAAATGISNIYHASEDRTWGRNFGTLGMLIMWDGVTNEAKEFWPDIRRKVLHKNSP